MKRGKNIIRDQIYDWLCRIYSKSDVEVVSAKSVDAPFILIKHSDDCQQIEITSYSEDGKHYSGWYFMPLSFQAFEQRLTFNNSKINENARNDINEIAI